MSLEEKLESYERGTSGNKFIKGKGFWISYNPKTDTGTDETALCQEEDFPHYLILNGNYIEDYRPFVKEGYSKCLEKYNALIHNGAERSEWSDDVD
jgi:hypothetical protein